MKFCTFLSMILVLVAFSIASADWKSTVIFNNLSSTGTVYSTPVDVRASIYKSIQVTGAHQTTQVAQALDGTFLLQCGPTSSGPWVTCKDQGGSATSATSNTAFNMTNAVLWVRGSWTKTSGRIKAWLTY